MLIAELETLWPVVSMAGRLTSLSMVDIHRRENLEPHGLEGENKNIKDWMATHGIARISVPRRRNRDKILLQAFQHWQKQAPADFNLARASVLSKNTSIGDLSELLFQRQQVSVDASGSIYTTSGSTRFPL